MLSRFARIVVALALLAAWQAALVHPLAHVDELGGYVHLGDPDGNPDKSQLCDALAALTACAVHAAFSFTASAPHAPKPASRRYAVRVAEPPPFLSQAPPALL
jgi:hypothetical protein